MLNQTFRAKVQGFRFDGQHMPALAIVAHLVMASRRTVCIHPHAECLAFIGAHQGKDRSISILESADDHELSAIDG